jgi:hypothetical protein
MKLHIGKEIEQRYNESGIKLSEFARRLNTSPRNVYTIFERADIKTDLLLKISEVLKFNFFSLYQTSPSGVSEPVVNYSSKAKTDALTVIVTLDGQDTTLNNTIKRLTAMNKLV